MQDDKETLLFEVKLDIPGIKEKAEMARVAIATLRKEKAATELEFKNKSIGTEEYGRSMVALDTHLARAEGQLKSYTKTLADNEKYTKSASGSNDKLRAELALLVPQLNAMSLADRNAEGAGKLLESRVLSITETLKAQESAAGDSRRNVGNYGDTMKTTSDKIADATSVSKDFIRNLTIMGVNVGQVKDSFKAGTSGMATFAKAIFTGRGALIALSAVPIVLVLTGLVTLLTKTQAGMDFIAKATGAVNAVFNVLIDRGAKLGKAFIDLFTNPKLAIQEFYAAITDLPSAMADAASAGVAVVDANQKIRESERALNVERAKNRAEIEKQKKISEDTNKSQEERERAARRAYDLENAGLSRSIELQQQRIANTKAEISLGQNTAEDKDKLAEEEIKLSEIREESFGKQTELQNQLNQIALEGIQQRVTKELAATDDQITNLQQIGGVASKVNTEMLALQEQRLRQQFELDSAGLTKNNQKRKALEIKLQADIAKLQYDSVIDYAELTDRVDEDVLKARLVNAKNESIELLEIQKQQIDQRLVQETAAATRTLKITEEVDAKLALLDAQALAEKEAIDKQIRDITRSELQDEVDIRLANSKAGSRAELEAKLESLGLEEEAEIDAAEGNEKKIAAIRAKYARQEADLRKAQRDEEIDRIKEGAIQATSALSDIFQAISTAQNQLLTDQENAALESAGANAEAREKIQAKFDEKRAVAEKKAAEQRRKITEVEAIINTAAAVIKAAPNPILMALAALTGIAQIAVIESQKFEDGGIIDGPSHSQGGVKFRVGKRNVELEGGEGVINKRSMAIPGVRERASALNELGGGIRFTGITASTYTPARLELGGVISTSSFNGTSGGASIDYSQLGSVVAQMVTSAVKSLPPQYVRVGEIRNGIGKQVRVENRAEQS